MTTNEKSVAVAMWEDESRRASGRPRGIAWEEEGADVREKWLRLARVALAAAPLPPDPATPPEGGETLREAVKLARDDSFVQVMNDAYFHWRDGPGGQRFGADPWAAFQAGYVRGIEDATLSASQAPAPASTLHVVFDGPTGPEGGRFVEVETPDGKSVDAGEWHGPRADGLYELRIPYTFATPDPAQDPESAGSVQWRAGAPERPWSEEWFIAETIYGDRVTLRSLPEQYSYDFKTADDTYLNSEAIKRWMQFPDSEFVPPSSPAGQPDTGDTGEEIVSALKNCAEAIAFFDQVKAATPAEQVAVGSDHWTWLQSACRRAAALATKAEAPAAGQGVDAKDRARRRIQALGAALSRRDWSDTERAYEAIRDAHDRPEIYDAPLPAPALPKPTQTAPAEMGGQ